MEVYKQQNPKSYLDGEVDDDTESEGFDSDCDSDLDPSFSILEETRGQLSNLTIKKKSKTRIGKEFDVRDERDPDGVNIEEDDKSFEEVKKMIEAGKIEKLKVDQCKVYLRKNGLRMAGKKATLIQRIMEHREILNGGGEEKYPVSSFVLNCKGDACTGDIVMFEQNVYEMYNIASRSASGPPCGTRIVVGRIVKENYGAAKQQHTFTIEVLWSKGEKPLPPLHPLLIKGRNLYRLKTLRQKWEDEGERQKILLEKHSRGSLARCARESRIQEKEMRKALRENRGLKKEKNRKQSQINSTLRGNQGIQAQQSGSSVNWEEAAPELRPSGLSTDSRKMTIQAHDSVSYIDKTKQTIEAQRSGISINAVNMGGSKAQKLAIQPPHSGLFKVGIGQQKPATLQSTVQPQNLGSSIGAVSMSGKNQHLAVQYQHKPTNQAFSVLCVENRKLPCQNIQHKVQTEKDNFCQVPGKSVDHRGIQEVHQCINSNSGSWLSRDQHPPVNRYPSTTWENGFSERHHHRQPLTSMNHYQQQQQCKFYAQGRCYYGDNCKFSHDLRRNFF